MKYLKRILVSLLAALPLAACAEDNGMTAEEMLRKGES